MGTGDFQNPVDNTILSSVADVIVVGSGISGTLAATTLGRAGFKICLVDRHAVYPPDFRAEHLDGQQVTQLHRLGFLNELTGGLYRGETVTIGHFGQILGTAHTLNFGLRYEDLVNRARAALPSNVQIVTGRVAALQTSDSLQQVRLSDGRSLTGRLIVLATGQGYTLCKQLGMTRHMIREGHSLTFGFDIEPVEKSSFEHSFVVYQRERIEDSIDYLAAFTMNHLTRINLFTYRNYKEPWTKAFLDDPDGGLAAVLPGLEAVIGATRSVGPIVARPTDLYVTENCKQNGIVLIGDAYQSSCPATGMGMVKLLTDVEQLCTFHIPRWLQTSGMGVSKISEYYHDSVKQACDAKALHDAEYRRSVSTETSLRWRAHRARVGIMERLNVLRHRIKPSSNPRISSVTPEPVMVRT